ELAEGDIDGALISVERGLSGGPRHAARVQLLNVRGDALTRRGELRESPGDALAAEAAWQEAAASVEDWRPSIPPTQLRAGLLAHQRHAKESLFESVGQRGDAAAAFRVTQQIIGRELPDRTRQREAGGLATTSVDDSVRDVEQRLMAWSESATMSAS